MGGEAHEDDDDNDDLEDDEDSAKRQIQAASCIPQRQSRYLQRRYASCAVLKVVIVLKVLKVLIAFGALLPLALFKQQKL